jgi:hypothetical protein
MTEKQEASSEKLIEYVKELARQHNELERRVELEAKVNNPGCRGLPRLPLRPEPRPSPQRWARAVHS